MSAVNRASNTAARALKVDIISDTLCPFCYLGLRQFQNAVRSFNARHPESPVDTQIRLLPYQLNPAMPTEPELRSVMYEKKFGKERAGTISQMMAERFRNMGLEPPPPGAQTSSSHTGMRLLEYALQNHPEKQIDVGEALFDAYHSKGVHPSDIDRMATIAVDKGIFSSQAEATAWLKGNEYEQEVQKGYVDARKMGITGVPFFVFQGKWASSGAIGEEEFETLLEGILKQESADTQSVTA